MTSSYIFHNTYTHTYITKLYMAFLNVIKFLKRRRLVTSFTLNSTPTESMSVSPSAHLSVRSFVRLFVRLSVWQSVQYSQFLVHVHACMRASVHTYVCMSMYCLWMVNVIKGYTHIHTDIFLTRIMTRMISYSLSCVQNERTSERTNIHR